MSPAALFILLLPFSTGALRAPAVRTTTSASSYIEYFQGTVTLQDKPYVMSCKCTQPSLADALPKDHLNRRLDHVVKACSPIKGKAFVERTGPGLTSDDIETHYGLPTQYRLSNIDTTPFMCADDRYPTPALYSLGGDLGEFLLALATLESQGTQRVQIPPPVVDDLFRGWISRVKFPISICTDTEASSAIEKYFPQNFLSLNDVAPNIRADVISLLSKNPNFQGDRFFNTVVKYPDEYQISPEILKSFLNTVYMTKWNNTAGLGNRIQVQVHNGPSQPQAIMDVQENAPCASNNMAAAMRSRTPDLGGKYHQIFIVHTLAIASRRNQMANYFMSFDWKKHGIQFPSDRGKKLDSQTLFDQMQKRGTMWLEKTVDKIFKSVPIFRLQLSD